MQAEPARSSAKRLVYVAQNPSYQGGPDGAADEGGEGAGLDLRHGRRSWEADPGNQRGASTRHAHSLK